METTPLRPQSPRLKARPSMSNTAKVIPINKTREPATGHLRNALQVAQCFMEQVPHMSEQSIASHAPEDVVAMRDRIQAALDIIEEVKESLADSNTMTQSGKSVAIARIKTWL